MTKASNYHFNEENTILQKYDGLLERTKLECRFRGLDKLLNSGKFFLRALFAFFHNHSCDSLLLYKRKDPCLVPNYLQPFKIIEKEVDFKLIFLLIDETTNYNLQKLVLWQVLSNLVGICNRRPVQPVNKTSKPMQYLAFQKCKQIKLVSRSIYDICHNYLELRITK
ncbi:hypothetical protein EGR_09527 [Echinococcus granulosus]|uniref:Uncharacterized protein n=1 Tax=Echinococcus granulosus TaxID=6210 RepID=W6UAZ4_ECHGR|nr:hypothetical protein EGR_09527 [Echinococcus granulosus]EUB55632.1 hypothetical protein EGR_09527 [Echinococcus granulosus]